MIKFIGGFLGGIFSVIVAIPLIVLFEEEMATRAQEKRNRERHEAEQRALAEAEEHRLSVWAYRDAQRREAWLAEARDDAG